MLFISFPIDALQANLRDLYERMSLLCMPISSVACGLAGLGATLYIVYRVWSALGRAEPIDVFGLLRPFAIGICIIMFHSLVIKGMNGLLEPIANATYSVVTDQREALEEYKALQDKVINSGAYMDMEEYLDEDLHVLEKLNLMITDDEARRVLANHFITQKRWGLERWLKRALYWFLELIHTAAEVILNVIRTFFLVVLTILGPIAFALSVFDGFQKTLTHWIAKYISIYLWLPIADIYGAIITKFNIIIIEYQLADVYDKGYYQSYSVLTLVFLLVAICGYFAVPTISNWIIQAGGVGSANRGINMAGLYVGNKVAAATGAFSGNVAGTTFKLLK